MENAWHAATRPCSIDTDPSPRAPITPPATQQPRPPLPPSPQPAVPAEAAPQRAALGGLTGAREPRWIERGRGGRQGGGAGANRAPAGVPGGRGLPAGAVDDHGALGPEPRVAVDQLDLHALAI